MTSTIEIAQKALAVGVSSPTLIANIQGKPVEHWSYKVEMGAALIGLVSAVAFYILNLVPAAVVGGILLTTSLFSAYFLHKFRLYDQLEDYIKEMADRIHLFSSQIEELKEANKVLKNIDKEMEVIPGHWHEEIEKGKKELLEVHQKFENLKKNYEEVVSKLDKFSTISKTLQDETGTLAQDTINFGSENKILSENVNKIAADLEVYKKNNVDMNLHNKELDQANKELDRLENEFNQTLVMIRGLFESIKDVYKKNKEMLSAFDKKIAEIGESVPHREEILSLNSQIVQLKTKIENLLKIEEKKRDIK